jgi:hypothetical protein
MLRVSIVLALLVSCTASAPPATPAPPTSAAATSLAAATAGSVPAATPSASPSPAFRDLTVNPAGDVRGEHILAMELDASQTVGTPSKVTIWDVPIDASAPRLLVSYTRAPSPLTDYDVTALSRQLSTDGRYLVISEAVDAAGIGLIVVDLVAGTARLIPLKVAGIQPAWSPDGHRIAFEGSEPAGIFRKDAGVWTVSASGGDERQVVPGQIAAGSGTGSIYGWTEDGKGVIFAQQRDKPSIVDVATGAVTQIGGQMTGITPVAVRAKRPSVAVVFDDSAGRGPRVGHVEVRDTMAASGRTVLRYGPDEGTFLNEPRWRPNSDEILLFYAFGQGLQVRKELVIVDAVTEARRTLATPEGVRSATWSADGKRIVYSDLFEARVRDADGANDHLLFKPATPRANENAFVIALAPFAPR